MRCHIRGAHLINQGDAFETYSQFIEPVSPGEDAPKTTDPAVYLAENSDTALLTDRFLETMTARTDTSRFAHLTWVLPLPPIVAPMPFNAVYYSAILPMPRGLDDPQAESAQHPFICPTLDHKTPAGSVGGFPDVMPAEENIQALGAIYMVLATEVDLHVGRVMQLLEDTDQCDNTLIVGASDHGKMLGDHHCWGKFTVHDAAYRTPLIMQLPEKADRTGTVVTQPVETIDITPPVLDWVGQDIPNSMDGRSLLPPLQGVTPKDWRNCSFSKLDFAEPSQPTFWEKELGTGPSNSTLSILRKGRFTIVEFAADLQPILYDYQAQGERENITNEPHIRANCLGCVD